MVLCDDLFATLQLKRLKLQKNNWDSDTYEFDECLLNLLHKSVVYEVVAKPVVEVRMSSFFFIFLFLSLRSL